MKSLRERIARATDGAPGTVLLLSANPMHDTGGGQRSAQIALELLEAGYCVVFVSHGRVTETVDLGLRFERPRLVETSLRSFTGPAGASARGLLWERGVSTVLTQVPVRAWMPVLEAAERVGAVRVYDCVDRWDSELGRGWYRGEVERRMAREADLVVASAPDLVRRLERMAEREVHLVPNAFNGRIFDPEVRHERPADLPDGRVVLYVGALWGGWLDWDLVRRAATALPDTAFVFIGDYRGEGSALPLNCVFLGLRPQAALPPYLAHADVAFLPWAEDDVTHATSPLKIYEFVAMGLPVVAPSLDAVTGIPGVEMVDGGAAFVRALGHTGRSGLSPDERAAMRTFSAANSWECRVRDFGALVGAARDEAGKSPVNVHAPSAGGTAGWPRSRAVISVVIPSYNHERFIGRAIDSVRAQTLPAGDLVVVDDGSSDGSRDLLARRPSKRMRVVHQENRGAHEAINRAIALSEGDYVAILNSDDFFEPERLEHAWGVARASGAALVVGGVRWVDDRDDPLPDDHPGVAWYQAALDEVGGERSLRRMVLRHNVAVTTSNFFLHRGLWRALGGFRALRYVHDLDFLVRALELCGDRVVFEPEMVDVGYRVHGANTIAESTERALAERRDLVRALRAPVGRARRLVERWRKRGPVLHAVTSTRDLRPVAGPGPTEVGEQQERPLKAGLVVRSLGLGGLEEIVALLARALPAHGVTPSVLCTHEGGPIATRLSDAGMHVRLANGRPEIWRDWIRELAPDVVSTHFAELDVVSTLAEHGLPIVETVQNTYAWFTEAQWEAEQAKLRALAATVAVSGIVARYHARHTGAPVTPHVIPNAVDPGRAAVVPRRWARRALGFDDRTPVIVHHGRFARQKNLSGLVRAFDRVVRELPDARLVLAGPKAERAYFREVRRAAPDLFRDGRIRVLGPVGHVGAFLSAADAFVSDSFFEGWSVAASEASWVGLPLVLSECGGSRELVGSGGERGRMVSNPVGDPLCVGPDVIRQPPPEAVAENERDFAAAVVDVLSARADWRARAPEIRTDARGRLGPHGMASAYADLFRSLTGKQ